MNTIDTNAQQDSEFVLVLVPVLVRKRDITPISIASTPLLSSANPVPLPSEPSLTQMAAAQQQLSPMTSQPGKKWEHKGMATSKQIDLIKRLAKERNVPNTELLQQAGVESFEQFTNANANVAIKHLKGMPLF